MSLGDNVRRFDGGLIFKDRNVCEECFCAYCYCFCYPSYLTKVINSPLVAIVTPIHQSRVQLYIYCVSCISKLLVSTHPSKRMSKLIHNRCCADIISFTESLLRLNERHVCVLCSCPLKNPASDRLNIIIQMYVLGEITSKAVFPFIFSRQASKGWTAKELTIEAYVRCLYIYIKVRFDKIVGICE